MCSFVGFIRCNVRFQVDTLTCAHCQHSRYRHARTDDIVTHGSQAGPSKKSEDESLLQLMAAEYELSSYSAFFDVEDAGSNFWRDVAQLVEEYKSELCSPTVTAEVLRIVSGCRAPVNQTLCDTVLPIVWEALQAHSDHDYLVVNAFRTVAALSNESSIGADAVVTSAGGMNLMQSRMRAHVESVEVQKQACNALCVIAQAASPASKAVNASDARQRHY